MKKKIFILIPAILLVFATVACNKKSESKNKLRQSNGRVPVQSQNPNSPGFCNISSDEYIRIGNELAASLNNAPKADIYNSNINNVVPYLFPNMEFGSIQIAKLAMRLDTRNPNSSRVVIRLYDEYGITNNDPLQLAMGNGLCGYPVELRVNGNQVLAAFEDAIGQIEVSGYINGSYLTADLYYYDKFQSSSPKYVGRIQIPVQGVIF